MRIAFLAPYATKGVDDGLGAALHILSEKHTIGYFDPEDFNSIEAFKPDRLLHHAAFTEDATQVVSAYPWKKALCFGGGPVEHIQPYDLYFVESEINEREFQAKGKPWMRAFGINDKLFTPMKLVKKYDACFAGSFSAWKRPELIAPIGARAIAIGQFQKTEKECYEVCQQTGVVVKPLKSRFEVATAINESYTVVNPASYWGGGQRLTLEAMACDIPPIVMNDSPKNSEYVEESGFGLIVNPDTLSIEDAIANIKKDPMTGGREYIMSKYSSKIYADQLEKGLSSL